MYSSVYYVYLLLVYTEGEATRPPSVRLCPMQWSLLATAEPEAQRYQHLHFILQRKDTGRENNERPPEKHSCSEPALWLRWVLSLQSMHGSVQGCIACIITVHRDEHMLRETQNDWSSFNLSSVATFLQKLRDIAAVPPRKYFLSRYHNHVTSSLLIQLSCGCVHTPLKPPATTWPSPMSAYTDWNKDFVEPVQDAVVQVKDSLEWRSSDSDVNELLIL